MLKTIAGLVSDDYVICVRRGSLPDGAELRVRDPRLIVTMPLHNTGERVARFPARPDMEAAVLGGIFMIPPDHELCISENENLVWSFCCVLSPALFERLMDGRPALSAEQLGRALDLRSAAIAFCMRQLMKEAICAGAESRRLTDSLVSVLQIELSRELFEDACVTSDARFSLTDERLKKVMDYIEAFEIGVPNVDDIAAQCGLSTQYFSRQFRERTGRSIGRFIAASRLRRAERILIETTLPLKEIAYRLGFANSATFSTAFRNEMGVPPGTYREQRLASFAAIESKAQHNLGAGARIEITVPTSGGLDLAPRAPVAPRASARSQASASLAV
jgi:AraC family transcriptional regulator